MDLVMTRKAKRYQIIEFLIGWITVNMMYPKALYRTAKTALSTIELDGSFPIAITESPIVLPNSVFRTARFAHGIRRRNKVYAAPMTHPGITSALASRPRILSVAGAALKTRRLAILYVIATSTAKALCDFVMLPFTAAFQAVLTADTRRLCRVRTAINANTGSLVLDVKILLVSKFGLWCFGHISPPMILYPTSPMSSTSV